MSYSVLSFFYFQFGFQRKVDRQIWNNVFFIGTVGVNPFFLFFHLSYLFLIN